MCVASPGPDPGGPGPGAVVPFTVVAAAGLDPVSPGAVPVSPGAVPAKRVRGVTSTVSAAAAGLPPMTSLTPA